MRGGRNPPPRGLPAGVAFPHGPPGRTAISFRVCVRSTCSMRQRSVNSGARGCWEAGLAPGRAVFTVYGAPAIAAALRRDQPRPQPQRWRRRRTRSARTSPAAHFEHDRVGDHRGAGHGRGAARLARDARARDARSVRILVTTCEAGGSVPGRPPKISPTAPSM